MIVAAGVDVCNERGTAAGVKSRAVVGFPTAGFVVAEAAGGNVGAMSVVETGPPITGPPIISSGGETFPGVDSVGSPMISGKF